jgi:hypothetical protein
MDWNSVLQNRHIEAAMTFIGGFVAPFILSLIKHWPAPFPESVYRGAIFDAIQDTAKNAERIGQRRGADSRFATATDGDGKTATAQSVSDPLAVSSEKGPKTT